MTLKGCLDGASYDPLALIETKITQILENDKPTLENAASKPRMQSGDKRKLHL